MFISKNQNYKKETAVKSSASISMAVVGISVFLSACSNLYEPTPQITKAEDRTIVSNTASLSHVIIYNQKNSEYSCTHPAPDAAFNQAEAGDIDISLVSVGGGGDSDSTGESDNSEETELAGRTPAVLITRELFYRLCEFSKNQNLTKDEAKDLYNKTLSAVAGVWKVEAGKTTVTIGDTVSTADTTAVSSAATQQTSSASTSSSTKNSTDSVTDSITSGSE
jgi:hypothetical protein